MDAKTKMPKKSSQKVPRRRTDIRLKRREALIEETHRVALRLFRTQGYEGTSLKEICDEAGISLRTLFRHWSGKDAILGYGVMQATIAFSNILAERPETESLIASYRHAVTEVLRPAEEDPESAILTNRLLQEVPSLRGQFLVPSDSHMIDMMDKVFARRLGISLDDRRLRLLRSCLLIAVIQAVNEWAADPKRRNLETLIDHFLALVAPVAEEIQRGSGRPVP